MNPTEFYDDSYHATRHRNLMENDEYFEARADAAARLYFSPEERQYRIFEYGCGIGQGIAALPRAAGWDISREAREACRKRNLTVYETLAEVPRQAWDIVLCRHVLEHVEQPLDTLRLLAELVEPGGELYLILPKEGHHDAPLEPDINQHLYCWNFRSINNLLHRAGFRPHTNRYEYTWGYTKLLPVRRWLGASAYLTAAKCVGRLTHNGELILRAYRV